MAKIVRFIELQLKNFTSHKNTTVNYGNITKLSGKNGQGKTSIGTAPPWILYGVDLYGKTFNPSPTNYEFDRVFASLILSIDGVDYKFAREIEDGKNAFYINDVPYKSKEFEATVASMLDKEEFLALYSPFYFFSLHKDKQRELIMKYTTPPARSEVLKELAEVQASKLDELTKKQSLDGLKKLYRDQKIKLEKAHTEAKGYTKAKLEQLAIPAPDIDIEAEHSKIEKLEAQIKEVEQISKNADDNNRKIVSLQSRIKSLIEQRERIVKQVNGIKEEPIEDTCRTCGQPLADDSIEKVKQDKQQRIIQLKPEFDGLKIEHKHLTDELAELEYIDVSEGLEDIRQLEQAKQEIKDAIRSKEQRQQLEQEIEKAKVDEAKTLASLKESIFILDAIKDYRAKEAELQASKVQSLFTTLSIRLFKYVESSDEWKSDFSIQMDDKDYAVLSAGEKISARLELTEVLFKQSELIVPAFIDNIESYTGKIVVYDQLITGRAVADQDLMIEAEGTA